MKKLKPFKKLKSQYNYIKMLEEADKHGHALK